MALGKINVSEVLVNGSPLETGGGASTQYTVTVAEDGLTGDGIVYNKPYKISKLGVVDSGSHDIFWSVYSDGTNIYAAGYSNNGDDYDAILYKYDLDLNKIAAVKIDNGSYDYFYSVYSDGDNAYVCGSSRNSSGNNDAILYKYDSGLNKLGAVVIDDGDTDFFYGITTDGTYTYVCGSSENGSNDDAIVYKYDSDLNKVAAVKVDNGNADVFIGITTDGTNIYTCGYSNNGSNTDGIVYKYDSDLNKLGAVKIDDGSYDRFVGITTDGTNIYVTGYSSNGSNNDAILYKYDSDLNKVAAVKVDNGNADYFYSVYSDGDNVYATGRSYNGDNYDAILYKYDLNLNKVAAVKVDNGSDDFFYSVYSDGTNVYATGNSHNGSNYDAILIADVIFDSTDRTNDYNSLTCKPFTASTEDSFTASTEDSFTASTEDSFTASTEDSFTASTEGSFTASTEAVGTFTSTLELGGRYIKSDASDINKISFVGFATTDFTAGDSVTLDVAGVTATQTGLMDGSDYWLANGNLQWIEGEVNVGLYFGYSTGDNEKYSQSFTNIGGLIESIYIYPTKTGTPTDNLVVRIETDDGGFPSGTLVNDNAIGTINGDLLDTNNPPTTKHTITFTDNILLDSSSKYHMVFTRDGALSTSDFFRVGGDTNATYNNGEGMEYEDSSWVISDPARDLVIGFNSVIGAISTTPGTNQVKVGRALSDTELLINSGGF